ncbi:MAG TPA: EpsI family protein [Bryobacteraceae bacterium]|nr:EpsI family protein [Bryobacteraceae bacterium]
MNTLLRSKFVYALTLVLVVQAALFYSASHGENTPLPAPLIAFPLTVGSWNMTQEGVIDPETRDILKADDLMSRVYRGPEGGAELFIAYFKTQREGQSPHSPKNCLPGSGWQTVSPESGRVDVPVPDGSIHINRFVVSKGEAQSVVYYWYQQQGRVIADEFTAKFYLVSDSIRRHRSDAALVRVVVPTAPNAVQRAEKVGADFIGTVYPVVKTFLPQ